MKKKMLFVILLIFLILSACDKITNPGEGTINYTIAVSSSGIWKPLDSTKITIKTNAHKSHTYFTGSDGIVEFETKSLNNKISLEKAGYIRLDTVDNISDSTTIFRNLQFQLVALGDSTVNTSIREGTNKTDQSILDSLEVLKSRLDSIIQQLDTLLNNSGDTLTPPT